MIRAAYRDAIAAALSNWSGVPSRWGYDDCALAIANIDKVVLGIDTAEGWRGRYRSISGAKRIMGKHGIAGMALKVAKRFKWPVIAAAQAQDGDRAIGATPGGVTCLIRFKGFWVGRCDCGNWLATDAQILKAWSII